MPPIEGITCTPLLCEPAGFDGDMQPGAANNTTLAQAIERRS